MENLIEQIELKINHNKKQGNQTKDGMILIELNKDCNIDSKSINLFHKKEQVDLSSMEFNEVFHVIKVNKRLLNDYFKFELYKTLAKAEIMNLIRQVTIPYRSLKQFIQYVFTLQAPSDIVIELIKRNDLSLTEEHMLVIIKNSLKLKKASSIIELIIRLSIDVRYTMDLIAQYKNYRMNLDTLAIIIKILKKNSSNRHDWLILIRNILSILVIQKEIKQSDYNDTIEDINSLNDASIPIEDKNNATINNDESMNIEGWNMELHNKLHNKRGVITETIAI